MRKYRDIKLAAAEAWRNYLLSEPNSNHATNFFSKDLLAIEMKKKQIYMNKHLYLSLSVLEISKIVMHEFWSDYMKQKYEEKEK